MTLEPVEPELYQSTSILSQTPMSDDQSRNPPGLTHINRVTITQRRFRDRAQSSLAGPFPPTLLQQGYLLERLRGHPSPHQHHHKEGGGGKGCPSHSLGGDREGGSTARQLEKGLEALLRFHPSDKICWNRRMRKRTMHTADYGIRQRRMPRTGPPPLELEKPRDSAPYTSQRQAP